MKIEYDKDEVEPTLKKLIPEGVIEGYLIRKIEIDYYGKLKIELFPKPEPLTEDIIKDLEKEE